MVISQQERTERFILKQNIFFKNPLSLYTIPRNNHGHWLNSRNSVFKLFKTYIFIYFFICQEAKKNSIFVKNLCFFGLQIPDLLGEDVVSVVDDDPAQPPAGHKETLGESAARKDGHGGGQGSDGGINLYNFK